MKQNAFFPEAVCASLIQSACADDIHTVDHSLKGLQSQIQAAAAAFLSKSAFSRRLHLLPEMEQEVRLTLIQAAKKFDSERGIPFDHYARRAIRNALLKFRKAVADSDGQSLENSADNGTEPTSPGADLKVVRKELCRCVNLWRGQITDKQRQLLDLHYDRGVSLAEIGRMLGVSRAAVSKNHQKIKTQCREALGDLQEHLCYLN